MVYFYYFYLFNGDKNLLEFQIRSSQTEVGKHKSNVNTEEQRRHRQSTAYEKFY